MRQDRRKRQDSKKYKWHNTLPDDGTRRTIVKEMTRNMQQEGEGEEVNIVIVQLRQS